MRDIKRAVVTGPTGTLGYGLIRELNRNGIAVTAVIRPEREVFPFPESALLRVVRCDLENLSALPKLIGEPQDVFYHLGWSGTYGADREDEARQMKNVAIAAEAVRAAAALSCEAFIFAGSQSEYGPVSNKLQQDTPCRPETAYGKAKLFAGEICKSACFAAGIRFVHVRVLSLYGPQDKPYTLVMSTIRKFLSGEPAAFTKGEQIWDYLFNEDAGRAFYLCGISGRDGAVYPLGSGEERTLRDYITDIRDELSPERELKFGEIPYFPHQSMYLSADISVLQNDTGFKPAVSFREGIRRTAEWAAAQIEA